MVMFGRQCRWAELAIFPVPTLKVNTSLPRQDVIAVPIAESALESRDGRTGALKRISGIAGTLAKYCLSAVCGKQRKQHRAHNVFGERPKCQPMCVMHCVLNDIFAEKEKAPDGEVPQKAAVRWGHAPC